MTQVYQPLWDEQLLGEGLIREPVEKKRPVSGGFLSLDRTTYLDDESDPLSAVNGVAFGVALGGLIWAVILWALL